MSTVTWKRPALVSWHRGGQELAPHATREAFLRAISHGAELIEIDVRQTCDGHLVCWHDDTTPNSLPLANQTLESVQGQGDVMLWTEFLDALDSGDPDRTIGIHLDLKDVGYEVATVAGLVKRRQPFFVTSLEQSSIALLRHEFPDEDAFLTIGRARGQRGPFSYAILRLSEVFPMWNIHRTHATGVAIHYLLLRPHLVRWFRRRNIRVVVWTVNSSAALQSALASDVVDAVTTNFPLKALGLRQSFEG